MRLLRVTVLTALLLAACGQTGGGETTTSTTEAREVTTTSEQATGSDDGQTIGIDEIPQECIDAFVTYLRAIEPAVEGIDFSEATSNDMEALGSEVEETTAAYTEATASAGCDDLNLNVSDEEAFDLIIDVAQREAPGTVPYFEWIRDFVGDAGDVASQVSGDCETDIEALMTFVARDGTVSDLNMAELTAVGSLVGSISTACSTERANEVFSDPEVSVFLETGG